MKTLEKLIDSGNEITVVNERFNAHDACGEWIDSVRQWIADTIPGSGFSAEWVSLGTSDLVLDNSVGSGRDEWIPFREMMNYRLIWLSRLQRDRLTPSVVSALSLAREIEQFHFCGPSDDPDEQTAAVYGFKNIAKRFAGSIAKIPQVSIPSHVRLDIDNLVEAYDLHADLMVVVDDLRNHAVGAQEIANDNLGRFINQAAIDELKDIRVPEHDARKLIRFCEEINSSYAQGNLLAVMLLLRALMNHVPPIFGRRTFKEVVAQSRRSVKEILKPLEDIARDIADHHSHATVRHNEPLPSLSQVDPFKPSVEFLVHELATQLMPPS
jgi:hypothetical protein